MSSSVSTPHKNNAEPPWSILSQKSIFFGHQSVGNNIILGIEEQMKENPKITLAIVETDDAAQLKPGVLEHASIGENEKPESKIQDFAAKMDQGIGGKADIAFFKFCFVDVTASTNIQKLFKEYTKTMAILKDKYSTTTFVHCTVPLLKKSKPSLKTFIKKLLGKDDGFFDNKHNVTRNEFNELMRREYTGKGIIFDIAEMESTYPDGTRETFSKSGRTYYSLVPEYTYDGGHLNEVGRKRIAEGFLKLIAHDRWK